MAKWMARTGGMRLNLATASMAGASMMLLAVPAWAQQQQQKAPAAAAPAKQAAPAAAASGQAQSAWVKLCEKAQYQKIGADGKPQMAGDKPVLEDKQLCLTHHEQMTAAGVTIVSAAIQQLEGVEKLGMMIMVPSAVGLTIPAGMRVFVYKADQWEKAKKNEKIDDKTLVQQNLAFTMCHQNGCTAENEATPGLIEAMKTGAAMVAMAIHVSGRPISFEVPLNGFSPTFSGKAIDNQLYNSERAKLWDTIKANQIEQMKRYQEQLQNPQAAAGAPAAGGAAPPAKAAAPAAAPGKK